MFPATSLIPIRDENPTRSFSWLTIGIIAANIAVFLLEPSFGNPPVPIDTQSTQAFCSSAQFLYRWGMIPKEILSGVALNINFQDCPTGFGVIGKSVYFSVITSMFVHGGWLHLAGNMLFLWIFGDNIEDRLGKVRFALFYLITGSVGAFAHALANPASTTPTIGASGAVAGLLGAYLVLFPKARITTIVPFFFLYVMKLPARAVIALWFISQFFIGASDQVGGGGVAWMAHVGGFVAGVLLIVPFGGRKASRTPTSPFQFG